MNDMGESKVCTRCKATYWPDDKGEYPEGWHYKVCPACIREMVEDIERLDADEASSKRCPVCNGLNTRKAPSSYFYCNDCLRHFTIDDTPFYPFRTKAKNMEWLNTHMKIDELSGTSAKNNIESASKDSHLGGKQNE